MTIAGETTTRQIETGLWRNLIRILVCMPRMMGYNWQKIGLNREVEWPYLKFAWMGVVAVLTGGSWPQRITQVWLGDQSLGSSSCSAPQPPTDKGGLYPVCLTELLQEIKETGESIAGCEMLSVWNAFCILYLTWKRRALIWTLYFLGPHV